MEVFWFALIAVIAYLAYRFTRKPRSVSPSTYHSEDLRSERQSDAVTSDLRAPAWTAVASDNGIVVKLSSDVTFTLAGPPAAAHEVETYLRSTGHLHYPERALKLALLMSRLNVGCPEIEAWRARLIASVERQARSAASVRQSAPDLEDSDPDLYREIFEEARDEAFAELEEKPSSWRSLDELATPRPHKLSDDDAFLDYVGHDIEVLRAFDQTWVRAGAATRLHDRGFVEWTKLVDAGLALRGADIPSEALVKVFKLSELNEAIRPPKPIRRKAEAEAQLTKQAIANLPNIGRVFYLKSMPPEVEAAEEAFGWSLTHAKLLLDTVRTFESVAKTLESAEGEGEYWIHGECCKASINAGGREPSRRLPARLPPFHISCEARLEPF